MKTNFPTIPLTTDERWPDQEKDLKHFLTFITKINDHERQRRVATQLILQADFFAPFQSAAARQRQEASALFCGGLVQAQDAAQLCRPHPLTCGRRATQHSISQWQEVGRERPDEEEEGKYPTFT